MKYLVCYPILYDCNLRCNYCFHHERFVTNYTHRQQFTIPQYLKFRDTHLVNPEDIIVHFHGGEPFLDTNINIIRAFLRSAKIERADLLTNGIQDRANLDKILEFKDRIHRIGFTYHRKMIQNIPSMVRLFEENVKYMIDQGVPVYVKELLILEYRDLIKEAKRKWKQKGVEFKIQDFKGCDRGKDFSEAKGYTAEDYYLIDAEYKRGGLTCSCVKNYKNVLICGHTMSGDVVACFEDMKIVGNIQENRWIQNFRIYKDLVNGRIDVQGVPENYKGTWDRGLYKPKACGSD
jgi:pyruvate-formate lyase-activating enzyme